MDWYVIMLIASAGLFVIMSIFSIFFGGLDIDVDANLEIGDVISFKGLIHFSIGFSLVLTLMDGLSLLSSAIGVITGIVFVLVLYYLYKMMYTKLQQNIKYTTDIKDMDAEVYWWDDTKKVGEVFVTLEGRPVTITLKGAVSETFQKGQKITVTGTRNCVFNVGQLPRLSVGA